MTAYYNECDPKKAAWLRELISRKLIAAGEVDERSIADVQPEDVRGFTQCHWFGGIGGWSYALRNAGWGDDESVWTGSCPCPPFSSAGKSKACPQCGGTSPVPHVGRTGYFVCCLCDYEWFADGRHLWPEMWRLISVCRPDRFFGEQVAGGDGRTWLASVRASLEILGYAVGAADLCSAGVGGADIRQRLFFVADSATARSERREDGRTSCGDVGHTKKRGLGINGSASRQGGHAAFSEPVSGMGKPDSAGPQQGREGSETAGYGSAVESAGSASELGDAERTRLEGRESQPGNNGPQRRAIERAGSEPNGPLAGFWADAEWIYCRDEKYRPVRPGSFPLASGVPARVVRLRGYGDAINAEVATAFISAYMEVR